jgi:aspartate racemase
MKTLGIIGGLSHESTALYYAGINHGVQQKLGGHNSASCIIVSLNFAEFVVLKEKDDWDSQAKLLSKAAQQLESAGANAFIIATNTMHKMADQITATVSIPLLHIADATAQTILSHDLTTIGLLGTKYTMEHDFYRGRLEEHGLAVLTPDDKGRTEINRIIYDELCHGTINAQSKDFYLNEIFKLSERGAQGVILGCTEIGMLVSQTDIDTRLFDTTQIHIDAAVDYILE